MLISNSRLSVLGGSKRLCTIAITPARLAEADALKCVVEWQPDGDTENDEISLDLH